MLTPSTQHPKTPFANMNSMLHHSNVDRLVALWQTIYYTEAIFNVTAYSTGQYGTPSGTRITAGSPLKPFFDENLNFHTTISVANISRFGYTYPEMPDWRMPPEDRVTHVRAYINSLYSHSDNGVGHVRASGEGWNVATKNYFTAEVTVNRSELPLPVILRLTVGEIIIGRVSLLSMPVDGVASISVPLKNVMVGDHTLKDSPMEKAIGFLQRELRFVIQRVCSQAGWPMNFLQGDLP